MTEPRDPEPPPNDATKAEPAPAEPPSPVTASAAPDSTAAAVAAAPAGSTVESDRWSAQDLRPVTVPVLISAIANLIAGYLWFFFAACFGVFLTAPMLVLCAFEIMYYVQAPQMKRYDLVRRTTALGIFEILLGVFNGVSFACGIVVLIQLHQLQERHPPATPSGS